MAVSISIAITQNSQSIANNSSNVTVKVSAKWTYGSWNGTGECTGSITIDDEKYSFNGIKFNTGRTNTGSQVIMEKTVTVPHYSDGTKTVNCAASFVTGLSSSGTQTAIAYKALTTIPRPTTPTLSSSSVDMGGKVTINTPRASSSFTHDLAYSFAGGSYVGIATGVGAAYIWTTPDLASSIPNATSGTVTIRCITKNGSTTIGTKTVTMTLKVPASVVPTIPLVSRADPVTNVLSRFGAFIQSKSKIETKIQADGAKGSTIKSITTTFAGKTYNGASFTTPILTTSGTLNMVIKVTDSRGRTATKTDKVTVLAYNAPAINAMHVYRVNEAGGADPDGIYIAVRYKYSVTSLNNKNTASMIVQYKQSTATEWATLLTGSALNADTTALPTSPTFSTDYQYDVRITVTDWFGDSNTYSARLQSGAVIMDIRADGLGLGFFKTAEREGVDFGAPVKGAALGLWEATANIPENANFNDYQLPGVYAVAGNAVMETLQNRPTDKAGTLRVSSGLGVKKVAGPWAYLIQEFHCYDNSQPIYRRHLHSNGEGVFSAGAWRAITFRGQKVLWEGGRYMTAGHTAELSEPVSLQDNGIVLVFSTYSNGAPVDSNFQHFFVPKKFVEIMNGYGCMFQMNTVNFSYVAAKYLYIHDGYITGNENNNLSGTATSGIVFNNAMYVLRYVLGV